MSEEITTMEGGKHARTLEQVTQEIRYLDSQAKRLVLGHAIEIGRRLTEAKEMVPYGEWGNYITRELEYSQSTANNFMRIYAEYGAAQQSLFGPVAESQTLGKLSYSKALQLLAVPREERESFAEEVDAEHLSTRELEAAIRERDEARKRAEAAEAREKEAREELAETAEMLDQTMVEKNARGVIIREHEEELEALEKELEQLRARPVDVAVQEPDPAKIEKRAQEIAAEEAEKYAAHEKQLREDAAEKLKKEKEKARAEREKLEAKLKEAEDKLRAAGTEDKAEADRLRAETERLKKALAMSDAGMVAVKLRFSAWQEAYRALRDALGVQGEEQRERMAQAMTAQAKAWAEG